MILLTINYDPDNDQFKLLPDGQAEEYVESMIQDTSDGNHVCINTSQECIIDWVRVFITRGAIPHEVVEFTFGDKIMFPDKYGKLDWWPEGFCDYRDNQLSELLKGFFSENK